MTKEELITELLSVIDTYVKSGGDVKDMHRMAEDCIASVEKFRRANPIRELKLEISDKMELKGALSI